MEIFDPNLCTSLWHIFSSSYGSWLFCGTDLTVPHYLQFTSLCFTSILQVYSVEDKEELESFVASPIIRVYSYGPVANGTSSSYEDYYNILQGFKHQVCYR